MQPLESDDLFMAEHDKNAVLTRLGIAAGRCGFLAGFSYYELSRLSTENAERVPEYLYCLLGSLTFSIACNGVWMWVSMYLGKRDSAAQLRANVRDIRKLAKCGYFFYQAACLLYAAGISQMVKVFNPTAVESSHLWGTFWHLLFLGEEYGMWIIIPLLVALELYFCYATQGLDSPRVKPSEHEADGILQLANRFAGRALFNVGFCQHALARYQYHVDGIYQQRTEFGMDRTPAIWMNAFFWHFVIGSTYCLLTVVYIATLFVVYIESVPTQCRQKYLSRVWAAWKYCRMSFHIGLVLALLGASLTGWGCSDVCDQPNVPGGACYAKVWYVPMATCSLAAGIIIIFRFYVRAYGRQVCREDQAGQACPELSKSRTDAATATMKMVGTIGDVGTIAAGFVMYNIATFDTDVIQGPLIDVDFNFGLTVWGSLFLWANWCAFAFGSAAALCVVEVELVYYDFRCREQQARFILGMRAAASSLCGVLMAWAMTCFLLAFGLFGLSKMRPMRVESLVVALLSGGLIMAEVVHLFQRRAQALRAADSAGPTHGDDHGDDALDGVRVQALRPHEIRLEQLSAGASRALLFGGFAYNAVSFIFRPSALLAPTYTIAMGLSFTSSIYVTVCEVAVNAVYTTLPSSRHQELFIKKIGGTLVRVQMAAVAYLMLFLAGFSIMGYIKLWTYDVQDYTEPIQIGYSYMYGWVQLVGALAAFAVIIPGAMHIRNLQRRMLRQDTVGFDDAMPVGDALAVHRTETEHDGRSWDVYSGALLSISNAMTFQTGNVFYEILFSAIGMNESLDYLYFGLSAVTLVLGCVGLVAASILLFWGNAVRASCRQHLVTQWLDETWHLQGCLKCVYTTSLLTWEGAMLFSSSVKYPKLWYASAGWSGFGILLVVGTGSYTRWLLSRRRQRPPTSRSFGCEGPGDGPEPASSAEEAADWMTDKDCTITSPIRVIRPTDRMPMGI